MQLQWQRRWCPGWVAFVGGENARVSQIDKILLWVEEVIKDAENAAENDYYYEWRGRGLGVEHFDGGQCCQMDEDCDKESIVLCVHVKSNHASGSALFLLNCAARSSSIMGLLLNI